MINRMSAFRVSFLAAILTLTAIFADAQTYKELGGTGQISNGFMARKYFHLPSDTVLSDAKNADVDTCQQLAKKDGDLYSYNCTLHKWVKITSGVATAVDSVRRSNDTLYFRRTTGGELSVPMDYYTKSESDNRYVLSPSGKIKTSWVNAWSNGIGNEVPNVADIDTKYMVVNASAGDTTFTVVGGTGTGDFTPPFVAVVYDHANDRYISFWVPRSSGSTYSVDRPLPALTGDTVKTMHDSYEGQHLTNYGYYSLADYLYFQKKQLTDRDYKLYSFYAEDSPTSNPFVAIGGAVQGGFIPSTSYPQTLGYVTANIAPHTITRTRYQVQQGSVAGRGVEWTANLGGKTGYLETFVGTNQQLPGHARVSVILDGITVFDKVIYGAAQKITVPFKNVSSGTLRIVTADTNPTSISVCRTTWYQSDVDSTTNMYAGGKIVFLGNSWTQFPFIGAVPMKAITERFKHHIMAAGGDPSDVINVGRGGMTSAWGKYWFKQLVLDNNPKYVYIEYFVNDANSSGSVGNPAITSWNFSSTSPYAAGIDVEGKVSQVDWIANINWMIDTAKAHGIIPIVLMNHPTGSILQTQTQSSWGSVLKRASQYYDIETVFSSSLYADKTVNTPAVTATNANIDTTSTRVISGGTGTTSVKMLLKNINSSANRSFDVVFTNSQAGTVNRVLSFSNSDASDFFFVTADGLAQAQGFNVLPTSNRGVQFDKKLSITFGSGAGTIGATATGLVNYVNIGTNIDRTIRMQIPVRFPYYSAAALPTGLNQERGAVVYDTTNNKFVGSNGVSFSKYFATEDQVFARYDSNTTKSNFIRNSAQYGGLPQTADILNLGTIRNDGAVVINGSLRLNTGTDNKWNLYYRDSTLGIFTALAPAPYGYTLKAGPGGKPEWIDQSTDFIRKQFSSVQTGDYAISGTGAQSLSVIANANSASFSKYILFSRSALDTTQQIWGVGVEGVPLGGPLHLGGDMVFRSYNTSGAILAQPLRISRLGRVNATNTLQVGTGIPAYSGTAMDIIGNIGVNGSVNAGGGIQNVGGVWEDNTTTVTGDYTLIGTDLYVNVNNSSNCVITIPSAQPSAPGRGRVINIKKISNNASTVTIVVSGGSQTIDGLSSFVLSAYNDPVKLHDNGSNWFIYNKPTTGTIPTLDQVTTAGNTTTNVVNVGSLGVSGTLSHSGALYNAPKVVTGTYSVLVSDHIILVDNSSAATLTLPSATGLDGLIYEIKKISNNANNVTIATTSSQLVDDGAGPTIAYNKSYRFIAYNGGWKILSVN